MYKKKKLIQIVDTLQEANEELSNLILSNDDNLLNILSQCQELAIKIGSNIDLREDDVSKEIVSYLEEYCEQVYQLSLNLFDVNKGENQIKKILKLISKIKNDIQYKLPKDKLEVVFLPYMASMWDSMESVWKAADEDPDTNAYVIPIPYYDKNPDGSFKEVIIEANLFPSNVPITNYEEYEFSTNNADMIFIHNPYDEFNSVTSVHPFFYSKNLKKFTEKLIYIPYFVLSNLDPNNQADVNSISHFVLTSGVMNADVVIVQSENIKQCYIKNIISVLGETIKKSMEQKIWSIGSPKIEKVVTTKRDEVAIPKKWENVIDKPNGKRKKVILFNTSIGALLHHKRQAIKKIESVFDVFKENSKEIALIWRPHPLIKATISSMNPDLWNEYKTIEDNFKKEGWGIYDESSDLNRAIAISDVYYGDSSSVVQLCQKVGMPVMIQKI